MWVIVFFDLPTTSKAERKKYSIFLKNLKKDGFNMLQYSIYMRHCPSMDNAKVHIKRVKSFLPPKGHVVMMTLTDKQFGDMEVFFAAKQVDSPATPQQLEMF